MEHTVHLRGCQQFCFPIIVLVAVFVLFLINPLKSQYVASQKGDKVEVLDIQGKFISIGYYSGLKDITQRNEIVVLWYESNKVEVRNYLLKSVSSGYYSDLKKISTARDNVLLYYNNGKAEVQDNTLKYNSSWLGSVII